MSFPPTQREKLYPASNKQYNSVPIVSFLFLSSLSTLENSQFVQLKKNNASKPQKKVVEQIRYLIKKGKGHFNADFN